MSSDAPRVWVGCLACSFDGRLIGEWFDAVDAPTEMDDWTSRIAIAQYKAADGGTMDSSWISDHVAQGHEELWVFDYEGFAGLLTGECSPSEAARLAEIIADVPEADRDAFAEYVRAGYEPSDFTEAYQGTWESVADYAEETARDIESIPDRWPFTCIDWHDAGRELELGGDIWTVHAGADGVYIFREV